MPIYLSHETALRYWLTKTGDEVVPASADVASLVWAEARMGEIGHARLPVDYSPARPLDVLVGDRGAVRSLARVRTHVWGGPLPSGAFNELSGRSYVSSPEFTFVQMAYGASIQELVELGCYLCGTFSIGDEGRGYTGRREALTTPERLRAFAGALGPARGASKARRALGFVTPGAASPPEVHLAMAFALKPEWGGWRMPEISENQVIPVDERLRALAEADHFVGDIYLPSVRGDIEYDSMEYHTGRYRLDHTQARRNVLEAMGVRTVSATWGQIGTFEKFEAFMWMVKERLGIEQHEFTGAERAAQMALHELMTDPRRALF